MKSIRSYLALVLEIVFASVLSRKRSAFGLECGIGNGILHLCALTVMLCMLSCLITNAQQKAQVEAITTEDGLSQGMINDILQDREGFLWIATKDGLNRYDGYEFKIYTNDPDDSWSISGNSIVKLFEDSKGRIWAASSNAGLNIYDKQSNRFHRFNYDSAIPTGITGTNITHIVEDSSGFFIVGIDHRELNMFRLEDSFFEQQQEPQVIRIQMPPQKKQEENLLTLYKGIERDEQSRIWVGVQDAIYQLDVQRAELKFAKEGYSIGASTCNPDGSLWSAGFNQSLFHWDGERASTYVEGFNGAGHLKVDNNSKLWILLVESLIGLDISSWTPGTTIASSKDKCFFSWHPENIPLSCIEIDRSGIVWIGTKGHGLFKINPRHLRFSHLMPGKSITQISGVDENRIFVQSYNTEWNSNDSNKILIDLENSTSEIENKNTLKEYFLVSDEGEYWIRQPFFNGKYEFKLKRYNPNTQAVRYYDIDSYHHDLQPMIETKDGAIWMAGFDDVLAHLDPETGVFTSFNLNDNGKKIEINSNETRVRSTDYSTALYEDNNNILWVGTERGFTKVICSKVKEKQLQTFSYKNIPNDPNSLSYNHVTSFMDDPSQPNRYLWISTKGGGINRMDKKSGEFIRLTKINGMPDDVVYGILDDSNGNIWGSTNKGLFCMSQNLELKEGNLKAFTFRNFSKADGLQENEFNTWAFEKLPDGRLAFGGVNGYNVFEPKEVLADDYTPPIYITNILVNNLPVSPNDKSGILINTIETSKKITLNHQQRILTLEFTSLDFNTPDRNKYRYQLVGADDTWVEAGNRRSATFLNLQPKEYTFRVQGSNSQGIWSDQIAELQISILPPWWKTWWAYLIYVALIGSAIWTYFRFSINRAKLQQQLEFEKRETDRVKDLDALKTQLYMNMTHEFRTPLTIILGMAKQVQDNPKEHFSSGLNMIMRNGQNLLSLVNKMLNLSKLESGKMSLELVQGDVVYFLRNIVESFRSFAANKEIQLHFLPEVDSVMMDFDADKLQQVVSNLISNAFKFTPDGGHVYFNLRTENASLVIRVKDTGRGIPQDDLENVFDRFYQVDNSMTRKYEGSGIGLALSKELVILMKGKVSVQSPPIGLKKGSEFMVVLPIGKEAKIKKPVIEKTPIKQDDLMEFENEKPVEKVNKATIESASPVETTASQLIKKTDKPLILLTEDNEDVAAYVASCLPDDYRLAIAENGQEGLDLAIELIPDLIISDVMMPIMDGFEFCQKLKTDKRTDHIPVIILTARADMESKLEGLELGANAYLPKPFEKQELLLTIRNLFKLRDKLQRHHQSIAGLVAHDDFEKEVSMEAKPEDAFVIEVRAFIEEHIDDFDLHVEQLATALHLSHSQFGRKLDALTGFSPKRFIRFIRLKKAKELLQDQDMSIAAVSFDCGFNDPSYFTRVFKKEFGKTPNDWRMEVTL